MSLLSQRIPRAVSLALPPARPLPYCGLRSLSQRVGTDTHPGQHGGFSPVPGLRLGQRLRPAPPELGVPVSTYSVIFHFSKYKMVLARQPLFYPLVLNAKLSVVVTIGGNEMTDIGITARRAKQRRIEREDGVFQVFYTRGATVISVILMCEKLKKIRCLFARPSKDIGVACRLSVYRPSLRS